MYRAIEERLAGRLDPEMFERCAVDLLREAYRGLVPVRGGDDGGMDGAIADSGGGPPIPLVATTAKDITGNLTRNLESYRSAGGSATEAVLATSRMRTARQRRNLEKRAGELGFVLRNTHDGADFAGRLYRDPLWRRELLGLAGDPPALSVLPRSPRRWSPPELVGRDKELDWLRQTKGDLVISGQPGVGKTALLDTLAKEGEGLFVVSRDIGGIADAYRAQEPHRIFVDDAHLDAAHPRDSILSELLRLRQEFRLAFRIVATTWPGHRDDIRHELLLANEHVLRVNPLERTVMAKIVGSVSPRFTDVLAGEILDQSGGRPGLAVTLAQWAQRGQLKDLVNGRLLLAELRNDIHLSNATLDALAVFALGGRRGMTLVAAAKVMEVSETHLREIFVPVSGSGVIHEVVNDLFPQRALSVKPAALRHALVQRTYFSGALSRSLEPAANEVEDAVACTKTLIGVLARGGRVPHDIIRTRLLEHAGAGVGNDLWEDYAWTGKQAAGWILSNHPEKSALVARAALGFMPDRALNQLISDVVRHRGDPDSLSAQIRHWVLRGRPGSDTVARRRLLLQKLARHIDLTSAAPHDLPRSVDWGESFAKLVLVAFALHFEDNDGDPITKKQISLSLGSLPANDVRELVRLWPDAVNTLRSLGDSGISCAREVVGRWCVGPRVLNELPETREAARKEAVQMLPGLIELADGAPGIVLWARRIVRTHGLRVDLPPIDDPSLLRLFPFRRALGQDPSSAWDLNAMAREFAFEWRNDKPKTVVERMLHYERQRKLSDHQYPDILRLIPNQLAQHVEEPSLWLEPMVALGSPSEWVVAFLEAAIAIDPSNLGPWWVIGRDQRFASAAVRLGLRVAGLSASTVDQIMAGVPACADFLSDLVPWSEMPQEWKRRLLEHPDMRVRGGAAAGAWENSRSRPRGALGGIWQAAVVECGDAELLREVLNSDTGVARAWMLHKARESAEFGARQAADDSWPNQRLSAKELAVAIMDGVDALDRLGLDEQLVWTARDRLTMADRRDLILAIPSDADEVFFRYLVGEEPDLYSTLLGRRIPRKAHLAPLRRGSSEDRDALVRLAQESGYTTCDIEAVDFSG